MYNDIITNTEEVDIGDIHLIHGDCLEVLRQLPSGSFDLAIVDPPYGNGLADGNGGGTPLRFHGGDRWNKYLSKVEQVRRAVRPIQDGQNTATCEDDTTDTITPPTIHRAAAS